MPNWCQNEVTVYAETPSELEEFITIVKGGAEDFSFQSIAPMPEELQGIGSPTTICTEEEYQEWSKTHHYNEFANSPITQEMSDRFKEQYRADNWYEWANRYWGTKWDVSYVELEQFDEQSIRYSFATAWGPPEGIYDTLVDRFPDLEISWFYREEGMQMAGYLAN